MLNVKNLKFHYQGGPQVLKEINFKLEDGRFLSVLGNNGAGKSTMLKCFNRIIDPEEGSISLDGEEIRRIPIREVAKRIAFVAQTVPSTQMTVHDMVMLGRKPYMQWGFTENDHRIVHEAMDRLGLTEMRGRFLNELSGGERQKVMLARALAQRPKLLLLDEPTSSLDLKNQYQVLQTVKDICHETGIAAIMVIHDLNLALRFCDRFLLMRDGAVFRYGDAQVIDREAIWQIYGVQGETADVRGQKIVMVD
ncbi:MAG TPA: ABC transporter ATP-binding protein [Candidatus Blautia gallistercoris]|uniref:ABC transporter ATP-binding protein n=1 Tax=Candidatus Blautia gallistercoris TaxID=2838490 RepID=A0A9D2B2Z3_9FIRM|nr:ABC transporter ATP-binding protein [Candidatus Blautia gallistercoris]